MQMKLIHGQILIESNYCLRTFVKNYKLINCSFLECAVPVKDLIK